MLALNLLLKYKYTQSHSHNDTKVIENDIAHIFKGGIRRILLLFRSDTETLVPKQMKFCLVAPKLDRLEALLLAMKLPKT